MEDNKRNFSRVTFQSAVSVNFKDQYLKFDLEDISLKGALISSDKPLEIDKNDFCSLEFQLGSDEVELKINARVMYKHKKKLGLRFETIELDSMIHLRRLVELNTENSDQIRKELFFLVKPEQQ